MQNNDIIPELSFSLIESGNPEAIEVLSKALKNHGFFSITNHGLSKELINKCYESSKNFFDGGSLIISIN